MVEETEQEPTWQSFLDMISRPFGGNCVVLLRFTDGKITIEGSAPTVESLGFVIEKSRPIYMG